MQPILAIALRAAQSAADKLNYTVLNILSLTADGDSRMDVFNKSIEDAAWRARKTIRNAHTQHHIDSVQLGLEESRDWDRQSRWVIDVACGEENLRNGLPGFVVNVALYTKDKIDCVAIVDPMTGDYMTAFKGRGVQFSDKRVRVEAAPLKEAICAIETKDIHVLSNWHQKVKALRVSGCALQNFVNLAAGRINIAVAQNMSPSDMASAMLIAQESGALTGDANGRPVKMDKGELMAAAPKLFKQLMAR
ncbi:inositol monophosphatase family protein [Reinekea marinisedimentorum]|uniref:Fructose-1,6-bisphosphatase/inositol monophosphatase family enzyme n=1 Tax=Reinekea marinisedimentorum TaxID=230495 RepID=A0A4R3I9J7_9GAMM|nr:inositol monophosphatase family protein [Reinekea marinisedimentorum]TCS42033.1 fructose-1,6-bisphosphatase/inositol monophosphatase family enzyme [Reinekea marinisedimentorum]